MILRRFMKHVTEQNWFAVGLDVIVVIVGIFLGLQVQAWYQEQNWRAQEYQLLQTLHTDMLENEKRTALEFNHREKIIEDMRYTAVILQTGNFPDNEDPRAKRALEASTFLSPLRLNLETYETIVQTGDISRLSSDEIRNSLYNFKRKLDYFNAQLDYRRDFAIIHYDDIKDLRGWTYDVDEDEFVPKLKFEYMLDDDVKMNAIMSLFRAIYAFQKMRKDVLDTTIEINRLISGVLSKQSPQTAP